VCVAVAVPGSGVSLSGLGEAGFPGQDPDSRIRWRTLPDS